MGSSSKKWSHVHNSLDEIHLLIVKLSFDQCCPVLFLKKQTFGLGFDTKKILNM
jgi:hypothetical protein